MKPTDDAGPDRGHRRPAPGIRAVVLCGAIACLGLMMCHSERQAPTAQAPVPRADAPAPAQAAEPAASPAGPDGARRAPRPAPQPAAPAPDETREPHYFPATKAPGPLR